MKRLIAMGTAIIAAVAAAGAGGLLIGRSQARKTVEVTSAATLQAEANQQYRAGKAVGQRSGQQSGEQDGYARGYNAGLARTNKIVQRAVNNSFNTGYKTAFEGFGSGWAAGSWYIVKIAPGPNGLPYQLATRVQMDPADYYDECPTSGDICGGAFADLVPATSTPGSPAPTPTIPSSPVPNGPALPSGPGANSLPTYPVPCGDGTLSPSGGHSGALLTPRRHALDPAQGTSEHARQETSVTIRTPPNIIVASQPIRALAPSGPAPRVGARY